MKSVQELSRRNIVRVQELPRETERRTVYGLSDEETRLVTCTKAQLDQRKVINPVRASNKSSVSRNNENVPKGL